MNEEQFVNIDLSDDDICGVCKLETAKEMLSFCHVCFELSIEGIPSSLPNFSIDDPKPGCDRRTVGHEVSNHIPFKNTATEMPTEGPKTSSLGEKGSLHRRRVVKTGAAGPISLHPRTEDPGVPRSSLLHTESVRGHRECFEKYHLIANQDLPRSKTSKSTYKDVKEILSRKISQIIQYAQNQPSSADLRRCEQAGVTGHDPQPSSLRTHFHQPNGSQLPRYSPHWLEVGAPGYSECRRGILEPGGQDSFSLGAGAGGLRSGEDLRLTRKQGLGEEGQRSVERAREEPKGHPCYTQDDLSGMSMEDLVMLNDQLLKQVKVVFEDLTQELEKKDSLSSELHVRYIAIEQLFKNRSKLPWLQIGRRGIKSSVPIDN